MASRTPPPPPVDGSRSLLCTVNPEKPNSVDNVEDFNHVSVKAMISGW